LLSFMKNKLKMGNLNESDKKSHAYSFLQSVESSYIS
jgi:hypothetical protein